MSPEGGAKQHGSLATVDVLAEQREGYAAGWAGKRSTVCPHRGPDSDLLRREAWLRGYAAARTDLRKNRRPASD